MTRLFRNPLKFACCIEIIGGLRFREVEIFFESCISAVIVGAGGLGDVVPRAATTVQGTLLPEHSWWLSDEFGKPDQIGRCATEDE